jgi:hypothetical protein
VLRVMVANVFAGFQVVSDDFAVGGRIVFDELI